jgi:hypothetical protein
MNGTEQLSLEDVTFLRAIRDINESPDRYASTERGETPATVTAITEATTLSEEDVRYRLDHPRLGRSELLTVYEARPEADDSARRTSVELTEAGERKIAAADDRSESGVTSDQREDNTRTQFDEMQEWEPAGAENDDPPTSQGIVARDAANATGFGAEPRVAPRAARFDRQPENADSTQTEERDDNRLAALESRIEELEAEQAESDGENRAKNDDADPERVDDLASEVASLRETTDRLAGRLDDAIEELNAIQASEYGAIDEKRERQFETAVKSMVAFHQLATKVLDVRVENYEPAAGRADTERVAITRERISDALGIGTQDTSDDLSLNSGSDWPDPEEAAKGGRVFGGGEDDADGTETVDDLQPESNAPDTGVYPPIGGNQDAEDEEEESVAAAERTEADVESEAPETGLYPLIGEDRETESESESTEEDGDTDTAASETGLYPPIGERDDSDEEDVDDEPDGALPASMRPGSDDAGISETASQEGHVIDAIRSTDEEPADDPAEPRLDIDDDQWTAVRTAIYEARAAADDPYPAGEAYARIVDEGQVEDDTVAAIDRSSVDADPAIDDRDD